MCKEMPVIAVNRLVDKKKNNQKNGGPRRRRGPRGRDPKNVIPIYVYPVGIRFHDPWLQTVHWFT
jgi:hypothetical protein